MFILRGYVFILIIVLRTLLILSSLLDYKYFVSLSVNELTRATRSKLVETKLYDCSTFKFKDGTLMKYYFDKYQRKYSLNEQQINKIKNQCKIQGMKVTLPNQSVVMKTIESNSKL